ncbi:cyclic nucleotide-gated ion channel 17 [Brassica rapa]|nr:cyclic nucleotide-gated ion channel 17 [Brassica rapa]XP_048633202.1 cyclic nucleotide-gated ion channel 17-like [Brassica napus]
MDHLGEQRKRAQAAWLRNNRSAMENHLTAVESKQSDEEKEVEVGGEEGEECVDSSPKTKMNTGVMVLASRFAANTRRGIAAQRPRFKKPEDPDFSAEPDD